MLSWSMDVCGMLNVVWHMSSVMAILKLLFNGQQAADFSGSPRWFKICEHKISNHFTAYNVVHTFDIRHWDFRVMKGFVLSCSLRAMLLFLSHFWCNNIFFCAIFFPIFFIILFSSHILWLFFYFLTFLWYS